LVFFVNFNEKLLNDIGFLTLGKFEIIFNSVLNIKVKVIIVQRLEFLGDSVLDLLITQHLYSTYLGLSPGYLTDLRSAAVNNENFARAAVKHGIQKYLRHGSGALLNQITKFVKAVGQSKEGECRFMSFGGAEAGPKVSKC
jgi:hypothetical protein